MRMLGNMKLSKKENIVSSLESPVISRKINKVSVLVGWCVGG